MYTIMRFLPPLQLKLPFPSFSKPSFEMHEDVKNLMKKPAKPKKEELPRFWTAKERIIVGSILGATILLSLIFWYKGQNGNIQISWPDSFNLDLSGKVVIEK